MGLIEPTVVPGLDKALLELLIIFGAIVVAGLVVIISSVVGIFRAARRRRRGVRSVAAVVLAGAAAAITGCWLVYWVSYDVYHNSNPIDALLAINLAVCVLPFSWLIAAIHANSAQRGQLESSHQ